MQMHWISHGLLERETKDFAGAHLAKRTIRCTFGDRSWHIIRIRRSRKITCMFRLATLTSNRQGFTLLSRLLGIPLDGCNAQSPGNAILLHKALACALRLSQIYFEEENGQVNHSSLRRIRFINLL